jgi:hypothetical protein
MKIFNKRSITKFAMIMNFLIILVLVGSENEWQSISEYLIEKWNSFVPIIHLLLILEGINLICLFIIYKKTYKKIIFKFFENKFQTMNKRVKIHLRIFTAVGLILNLLLIYVINLKSQKLILISLKFLFFHASLLMIAVCSFVFIYGTYIIISRRKRRHDFVFRKDYLKISTFISFFFLLVFLFFGLPRSIEIETRVIAHR